MAIGDAFVTAAAYRARIVKSSSSVDSAIESSLKTTSRWLERILGVESFNKDGTATSRVYIGNGSRCLDVAEIASTAGLAIKIDEDDDGDFSDETALATTDYELRPLNADKGPEAKPWTEIYLPNWSNYGVWPAGQRVQVTAIHGWPAVPDAIANICIEFTSMMRGESPWFTGRIAEIDDLENVSPQARGMLNSVREAYWMPSLA